MHVGQPSHGGACWWCTIGHPGASFATSDCWQSTQLRGGLDHAPVSRRCSNISQKGSMHRAHTRLSCSYSYPRFDSAAGLGQIPLIPVQTPYLILSVTGFGSASGPIPGNGQHCLVRIYTCAKVAEFRVQSSEFICAKQAICPGITRVKVLDFIPSGGRLRLMFAVFEA